MAKAENENTVQQTVSIEPRPLSMTPDIERQALRMVARDPNFVLYWVDRLKPEHFNNAYNKLIFIVVSEFLKKYKTLPTNEILCQEIPKKLHPDDNLGNFTKYITEFLTEENKANEVYVRDCLMDHMKTEDFRRFIMQSASFLSTGKTDSIQNLLTDISKRHTITPNVSAYLENEFESVSARVEEENSSTITIPSPWPAFNANHGGGFQAGTLGIIMGPTGSGKSIILANLSSFFTLNKKVVYFFTFELSRMKTMGRHDVILTGVTYKERKEKPKVVQDALDRMKNSGKFGSLYIIQLPTGECSVNKVKSTIDDYVARGCPKPDVVILDYLTIMSPNDPSNVDMKNEYARYKVIAEEARAMAMERQHLVLTAVQTNRGAEGKEKIKKDDVAGSYALMHVIDLCITINQTDAEKTAGEMRLFAAKVRDFADNFWVYARINYQNLTVKELEKETKTIQENYTATINDTLKHNPKKVCVDPLGMTNAFSELFSYVEAAKKPQYATDADKKVVDDILANGKDFRPKGL
jgi:replicative DNA helicase